MSSVTLAEALKQGNTAATAERNLTKGKYKPWYKRAAILGAALFVLSSLTSLYKEKEAEKASTEARGVASTSKPTMNTVVEAPKVQVVAPVQRTQITLTTDWSKGIRVMGDQCIQWWGENPTGYDTQASGGPIPRWKDWAEWKRMRTAGRVGDPWQFRFRAKEGTLNLEYEIKGRNQCIKK